MKIKWKTQLYLIKNVFIVFERVLYGVELNRQRLYYQVEWISNKTLTRHITNIFVYH